MYTKPKIKIGNEYTVKSAAKIDAILEHLTDSIKGQLKVQGCDVKDSIDSAETDILSAFPDISRDDIENRTVINKPVGVYVDDENTNYSVQASVIEVYFDDGGGGDLFEYVVDVWLR